MYKLYKDINEYLNENKNEFDSLLFSYNKVNRSNFLFTFKNANKEYHVLSINHKIYTVDLGYDNYDEIVDTLITHNLDLKHLKDNNLLPYYNNKMYNTKVVVLAGGCFWCSAKAYYKTNGIKRVYSGYCGGAEVNPKYEDVKKQKTHHQESIMIIYDETKTDFNTLFNIFFNTIDPFDNKGQFIDRGHSYTTAVFTNDKLEKKVVKNKIKAVEDETKMKVYLPIKRNNIFYMAEEYHQDFHLKHPDLMEKELKESGRLK